MEEYYTVSEVSSIYKLAKQTIYNWVHQNKFVLGKHFIKPSPKKLLFIASEVKAFMLGGNGSDGLVSIEQDQSVSHSTCSSSESTVKSLINI